MDCEITVDTLDAHYWNYKINPKEQDKSWGDSIYTDFKNFKCEALKVYSLTYWQQNGLFFGKVTDLTGYHGGFTPAHLWFLLYLFVISLAALLIVSLQKKYLPEFQVSGVSYLFIILLFVPEWLCQYVINIGGKSLGQFMILFLFGYYVLSEESILQKRKQYQFISLSGCILSGTLI